MWPLAWVRVEVPTLTTMRFASLALLMAWSSLLRQRRQLRQQLGYPLVVHLLHRHGEAAVAELLPRLGDVPFMVLKSLSNPLGA